MYLKRLTILVFTVLGTSLFYPEVSSHGRLTEPPSRSSMWRYGFNTTANYNDHELYCGGFARLQKNKGCGVCGDPLDAKDKPNEAGGIYAQGIIVRKYRKNSIIRVKVELTANHKGYWELKLCPNNNPKRVVRQSCLDNNLLQQSNSDGPRYYPGEGTKVFESRYILPKDLTCTQCVLQWRYQAANSWGGPCPDGSPEGLGCGPQEEFRACSDIAIYDDMGYASAAEPEYHDDTGNTTSGKPTEADGTEPSEDSPHASSRMWPFLMAFIALIIITTGFGGILWWFYRKEVINFVRERILRPGNGLLRPKENSQNNNPSSYYISQASTYSNNNHNPPVVPPRTKKFNHTGHHPDVYGQKRQKTSITMPTPAPDVILQHHQQYGFPA